MPRCETTLFSGSDLSGFCGSQKAARTRFCLCLHTCLYNLLSCRKEGFLDSGLNLSLSTSADIQLSMGGIVCVYFLSRYFGGLEFATLVTQFVSAEVVETLPTALDKTWIMVLILEGGRGVVGFVHPRFLHPAVQIRCITLRLFSRAKNKVAKFRGTFSAS